MEKNLILEIAKYYYIRRMTQEEISKAFRISRMKVVRYLKEAREKGYIKIQVTQIDERCPSLEKLIKSEFKMKEVIISPDILNNEIYIRKKIGQLTADYLKNSIKDNNLIGIAWGRTLYDVVSFLSPLNVDGVKVIQIVGGLGRISDKIYPNEIVERAAFSLGSNYYVLHAPLLVDSKEAKQAIISNKTIKDVIKMWDNLDIVLSGVASIERSAHLLQSRPDKIPYILQEIKNSHAVGELCGVLYDINGKICNTKLNDLVVAINPEQICNARNSILVAGGKSKIKAIVGALRGNFIKTMVTDELTAKEILNYYRKIK